MTLVTFVRLCRRYADLGDAVTAQLQDVLDGSPEDANPNALRLLLRWLRDLERVAWDDDELGDEVTGAVQAVETALQNREATS